MATEFFISPYGSETYARIDLESGIPLPVTYNILDIRNPDKRNAHWSKTLVFPGTKNNNEIFEHIFEIGIDGGFNANKKADIYVLRDTLEELRGVLQLKKITRDKKLDRIMYECAAFGGIDDLFTALGESKLTDIDFTGYNHTYDATTQVTSWSAPIGEGYVYPLVDYNGRQRIKTGGLGLVYDEYRVDELFAAFYVKTYWDKIFNQAGKTYTSDFIDSDFFKRLIIPYSSEKYLFTNEDIEAREFRAELSSAQSLFVGTPIEFDDDSTGLNYDPAGVYNTGTYEFVIQAGKDGYYSLEFGAEIAYFLTRFPPGTTTATGDGTIFGGLILEVFTGGTWQNKGSVPYAYHYSNGHAFANGVAQTPGTVQYNLPRIYLRQGEKARVYPYITGATAGTISGLATINMRISVGAYFKSIFINEFTEGVGLVANRLIPENVKMRDFLKSIIQMFHLYLEVDADNPNNYIIEPRDDWYTAEVVDWSAKLDVEKGIEIFPMSELQGRRYNFRYKQDKDYYNDAYQNRYFYDGKPRTYGDYILDVDNDFVTEEITNELVFSPTPLAGNAASSRVVPAMYALSGNTPVQKGCNIRIMYYGGLLSYTGISWQHKSDLTGTSYATYPYAGHLDNPLTPTLDLSFGMPIEVNWSIRRNSYTDNNLYNKYHRRFIEEITDTDARMVTGYFLLTPADIFSLSFRKLYFFAKELYRLNKIIDYDLAEYKLVKCEFIKVKDPGEYVSTTVVVIGGGDDEIGGETLPDYKTEATPQGNILDQRHQLVTGQDNIIDPSVRGAIVSGDGNVIGAGAANVVIQGNRNVVLGGIENVALIQTSDVTVTESNTLYINGCQITDCPVTESTLEARAGTATLTGTTVNVPFDGITTASVILLTPMGASGTIYVTPNTDSFDITSSASEGSVEVGYFVAKF